jgi:hypothetical protein
MSDPSSPAPPSIGSDTTSDSDASTPVSPASPTAPTSDNFWAFARGLSATACAYHGYRRSGPVGALLWAVAGVVAPFVAPGFALAQGFGRPEAEAAAWRAAGYPRQWTFTPTPPADEIGTVAA